MDVINKYFIKMYNNIYFNVNIHINNVNIVDIKLYNNLLIYINQLANIN